MSPRIQHIVATRFSILNNHSPGRATAGGRFSPEWLEERLELLRRYPLRSLAAQEVDFVWMLFCDETTDSEVLACLREYADDLPGLAIALTNADRSPHQALGKAVDVHADVLLTTRLDSDDALADGYLEATQEYAASFHRSGHRDLLVNFPRGYRLDAPNGDLYEEWMSFSPFHTLFERPGDRSAKTVLHGGHGRLHYEHPTHQDESIVGWTMVVHGGNVINRIRDGMPPVKVPGVTIPGFSVGGLAPQE